MPDDEDLTEEETAQREAMREAAEERIAKDIDAKLLEICQRLKDLDDRTVRAMYEAMNSGGWSWSISPKQAEKAQTWMDEHRADKKYAGAIGGRFTWRFTHTGVGVVVKVADALTGDELDVSDYEDW